MEQEQQVLYLVVHRAGVVAVPPVAYCWTFPLAASTRTVCRLVAVAAAVNLGMWVASGSTAVAGTADEADRAAVDSAGTDWVPHSIGLVFRVLQVDRQGHRVVHWDEVHCGFPTAVGVPGEDIGRGTDLHRPANHQLDTSAVAAGTVDTVVDSSQNRDVSSVG